MQTEFDVRVNWVHFPLHPETPVEGASITELYARRGIDVDAAHERMKSLMDEEGLPYGRRTHTYNSRLAQELGKWADTVEGGESIHGALYAAYFVHARNIADVDELVDIAGSVGLATSDARKVLETRSFKEAVDSDWARSRQYGITGVPTFVAGGYGVVGAQPYDVLVQLLDKVGAGKRDNRDT